MEVDGEKDELKNNCCGAAPKKIGFVGGCHASLRNMVSSIPLVEVWLCLTSRVQCSRDKRQMFGRILSRRGPAELPHIPTMEQHETKPLLRHLERATRQYVNGLHEERLLSLNANNVVG